MIKTATGDSQGHLVFHTKSGLLNTSRCSERMRIQADGFIGVNTLVANKQLSINHSTGACLRLIRNNTAGSETLYSDLSIDASGNLVLTSSGGYIDLQALKLNGSIVTSTATELNYNDITTIGTAQASKSLVTDANIDISSIRRLHCANISIGTSDFSLTSRLLVMVDSTLTAGGARYLTLGKSHSTYNNAEWGYYHVGDGNSLNRCEFGFYGANGIFAVVANRRVGINTTTPTVELDVSGAIAVSGLLTSSNTSVSTTSTSNSVQFSGGLYTAKAILNNSYYNCNTINSSAASYATSLQAICLNDHAIYFRSQNSGDTSHGLMYSKNASWNSGNGFASANVDGPVLYGNAGVLIGNLLSGSTQTECARFVGTLATIKTKLIVNTSSTNDTLLIGTSAIGTPGAQVGINSLGQHIRLIYNNSSGTETIYGVLGVGASGQISLTPVSGATSTVINILPTGFMNLTSSNLTPRYNLDFGSTAANVKICLYETGSNVGTQGLGCSATDMYYLAQTNHKFYKSSTNGALTTLLTTIDSTGITVSNSGNVNITKDTYGFNHKSGSGVDIYTYANGNTSGAIGTYSNHDFFLYTNNSSKLYITAAGLVGIGTTSPSVNLHVVGTTAQSNPFTFGYLSSAGAGTSTGFTNRQFSIRSSGGILCDAGEIDVFSDIRMKKDIEHLDLDICNKFIDNIQPISYKYKNIENDKIHYGFNAQELMKYGFSSLVGGSYDENDLLEESIVECDDGNTIKLEKNTRLVVSMLDMIPILMNVIKEQKKELTNLKKTVNNLEKKISS